MVPLEGSRLLRHLLPADIAFVRDHSRSQVAKPGEVIFREGDSGSGLYIVHQGQVDISVASPTEQEYLLMRFEPGDHFGEMAVFDGGPRSATATARGDVELTFVPAATVEELVNRSPKLAASLVRDASLRIRDFNRRFLQESLRADRLTLVERLARSIVHDFRNPLNVIGIAADLAAEERATIPQRREARDRIRKQVEVLNRMMQELLDFTKSMPVSVVLPKVNYGEFLRDVLFELKPEAARRGIELVVSAELPDVLVRLDPPRFTRVFANLAQNAFDALSNRPGGRIQLSFAVTGSHVVTEFADNGPGIAPAVLPHVFEPFITHGKSHGTGLGLAICERILVEHGGQISAHSEAVRGATISFILPLARPGETEILEEKVRVVNSQAAGVRGGLPD